MNRNKFKRSNDNFSKGFNKTSPNKDRRGKSKNGRKSSIVDYSRLIQKAVVSEEQSFLSDRSIGELPISPQLKQRLINKGFERPTEIQDRSLEALLRGQDILGIAQTGTGKTGAFLIPIIETLLKSDQREYALIVVPTRELAMQVNEEFRSMTKSLRLYSACFIGGTNINSDFQALQRSHHVIIGTPGRLLDLANQKALRFGRFNTLVLDEFDRMLDMGFAKDVQRILSAMHNRNHTMLFSATLDKSQQGTIDEILHNPLVVKVSSGEKTADQIDQDIIELAPHQDKFSVLLDILRNQDCEKAIVFDETKHRVSRLCQKLNQAGIRSEQIQGNKSQNARQRALEAFKNGEVHVLVATDVAARGLDVPEVSHVINYQLPMSYDSYIHRIGRTGRAGKSGIALTFVDQN